MIEYKYNSDGDYFDGDRKRLEKKKAQQAQEEAEQKKRFTSWTGGGEKQPDGFPSLSHEELMSYCEWGKRLLKKSDAEFLQYWKLLAERVMAHVGDPQHVGKFVAIIFAIVATAREELMERGGGDG